MPAVHYSRKAQIEDQLAYLTATTNLVWKYFPADKERKSGPRWTIADGSALYLDLTTREMEVWLAGVTFVRRLQDAKPVAAYRVTGRSISVGEHSVPGTVNYHSPADREHWAEVWEADGQLVEPLILKGDIS